MEIQVYRTNNPVVNLTLDRRCKDGIRSMHFFPSGTLIVKETRERERRDGSIVTESNLHLSIAGKNYTYVKDADKIWSMLEPVSCQSEPATAAEFLAMHGERTSYAEDVLLHMLDKGMISMEQFKAGWESWSEQE